jgi:hypothetical protein
LIWCIYPTLLLWPAWVTLNDSALQWPIKTVKASGHHESLMHIQACLRLMHVIENARFMFEVLTARKKWYVCLLIAQQLLSASKSESHHQQL